jgi:hypothetical protein
MRSEYSLEDAAQAVTRHLAAGLSAEALYGTDDEETYNINDAGGFYVCRCRSTRLARCSLRSGEH